jgi:hypothetical protein
LSVQFEYAAAKPTPTAATLDMTGLKVPPDLLARLREATERFSLTRLEQGFAELDGLGEAGQRVAAHLRALAEQGNLSAIADCLKRVEG